VLQCLVKQRNGREPEATKPQFKQYPPSELTLHPLQSTSADKSFFKKTPSEKLPQFPCTLKLPMVQSGAKWCKMEHNFRKATLWLKLGGNIKKKGRSC